MKRMLTLILALSFLFSAAAAEGENTLLRRAVELARQLDALAEDTADLQQYTGDPQVLAMARDFGAGSHDQPGEVRAFNMDVIDGLLPEDFDQLPEAGQRQVRNRLPAMLLQNYVNSFGAATVVLSAALRVEDAFADQTVTGQGLWILRYVDAAPVAVSWYAENGAVFMQAQFLPGDLEEFPDETHVIAAARPELDAHAHALARELQTLAADEGYLAFLALPEQVLGTVLDFAAGADAQPRLTLCALADDLATAEAALTEQASILGMNALAAVGAVRTSVIFAHPDASGAGVYLFLYEDGAPVRITWRGQNGAYVLEASFQPGENPANCRSAQDADEWAASIGLDLRFQQPGAILLP